jgi:hypothetical protein
MPLAESHSSREMEDAMTEIAAARCESVRRATTVTAGSEPQVETRMNALVAKLFRNRP